MYLQVYLGSDHVFSFIHIGMQPQPLVYHQQHWKNVLHLPGFYSYDTPIVIVKCDPPLTQLTTKSVVGDPKSKHSWDPLLHH